MLSIRYRGQRADIFTGLYCNPRDWNKSAQRVYRIDKMTAGVNENLDDIRHKCMEKYDEMKYSGKSFILDEFVMNIRDKEKRPETLVEYLREKVEELKGRVGIDITLETMAKYKRSITYVQEFLKQKIKNRDIAITSLTTTLLMDYFYFLRLGKKIGHNTSVNYIKCLKTVLMPAIKHGLMTSDPFYDLKLSAKVINRGFLSVEEIGQLESLKDLQPGISQALDIFLFACYTGMAYIDVKQFSRKHLIKEADGS